MLLNDDTLAAALSLGERQDPAGEEDDRLAASDQAWLLEQLRDEQDREHHAYN